MVIAEQAYHFVAGERHRPRSDHGPRLVILGLLIPVAFGKWGSYLGLGGTPVYFADLLIATGFLLIIFYSTTDRGGETRLPISMAFASVCVLVVLGIGLLRSGELTIFTLRDAVAFVYLAMIPAFCSAVRAVGIDTVVHWLRNASIIHSIWFVPAIFGLLPEVPIPLVGGEPAFSTREDFDLLICGVAVVLIGSDRRLPRAARSVLVLATAGAALSSGSRAGLIAALAIVLTTSLAQRPFADARRGPQRAAAVLLALIPLILTVLWLTQNPPAWALGLQKLIPNNSAGYTTGQNTWGARESAWQLVLGRLFEEPGTTWGGFGFGSDFIIQSGALPYLSGDPNVRAAHNFGVTWMAMVGLVGVVLVFVALFIWFARAAGAAWSRGGASALGLGMMIGVVLAASAGVILESPFGYMTFGLSVAIALNGVRPAGRIVIPSVSRKPSTS